MVVIPNPEQEQRVNVTLAKCRTFFNDTFKHWETDARRYPELPDYFQRQKVLEIGPGLLGGLSPLVFEWGAESYLGVDISGQAVSHSKKIFPGLEFICDDPVYVIRQLSEPHLIISSAVFDNAILPNQNYVEALIRAIYENTKLGGYSLHFSFDLFCGERDHTLFLKAGFIGPELHQRRMVNIYKRPEE